MGRGGRPACDLLLCRPVRARPPTPPPHTHTAPAPAPPWPRSQFKDHLKKAEAVSEFAKSKSIAEQRRFLPVYSVREEMMQVGRGGADGAGRGWAAGVKAA